MLHHVFFLIRVQRSPRMHSTASHLVVLFVAGSIHCNSQWNCRSSIQQDLPFCLCKEQLLSVSVERKQLGRFQVMQCLCNARGGACINFGNVHQICHGAAQVCETEDYSLYLSRHNGGPRKQNAWRCYTFVLHFY